MNAFAQRKILPIIAWLMVCWSGPATAQGLDPRQIPPQQMPLGVAPYVMDPFVEARRVEARSAFLEGSRQGGLLAVAVIASAGFWAPTRLGSARTKAAFLFLIASVAASVTAHMLSGWGQRLMYGELAHGHLAALGSGWVVPTLVIVVVQCVLLFLGIVLAAWVFWLKKLNEATGVPATGAPLTGVSSSAVPAGGVPAAVRP